MGLIWSPGYYEPGWRIGIDTGVTTDFSLITNSTCNVDINWGDGNVDTGVALSGNTTTTHNYSTPGTYTVEIDLNSGDFRPYYANNSAADEIITLGDTPAGWSFGTSLNSAFRGSGKLTTVGDIDTSAVTDFFQAWRSCVLLTSFSAIDTSEATTFERTWSSCKFTSFPLLNPSKVETFYLAWSNCSDLEVFPANFFDSWTGTPANNCFLSTWGSCSSLTATSVEDILNSIDTSGQSAPGSGPDITIDYDAGTGTPSVATAVTNLKGRGWTITLNGAPQ